MNYITDHKRHLSYNRIGNRHRSFRKHPFVMEKYEWVQRVIILVIIISCIALVATVIAQF